MSKARRALEEFLTAEDLELYFGHLIDQLAVVMVNETFVNHNVSISKGWGLGGMYED